ncbi:MAG: hypothetical protein LBD03_07650 [Methanobrevibacter sp.]|jgi:hypothetical protein|nr:hypothetical protein [Candidatus Methanovirga procula]
MSYVNKLFIYVFMIVIIGLIASSHAEDLSNLNPALISQINNYNINNYYSDSGLGSFWGLCCWYEDIDIKNPFKDGKPNYKKYDLLSTLKEGDVVYDPTGFDSLTGHTLIVEGKFKDPVSGEEYIRGIEASGYVSESGVVCKVFRSIIDDSRVDDKSLEFYRLSNGLDKMQRDTVLNFLTKQLGKPYTFNYFYVLSPFPYDVNTREWYCSLFVWAAYRNIGMDIRQTKKGNPTPFVIWPADISRNSKILDRVSKI